MYKGCGENSGRVVIVIDWIMGCIVCVCVCVFVVGNESDLNTKYVNIA